MILFPWKVLFMEMLVKGLQYEDYLQRYFVYVKIISNLFVCLEHDICNLLPETKMMT